MRVRRGCILPRHSLWLSLMFPPLLRKHVQLRAEQLIVDALSLASNVTSSRSSFDTKAGIIRWLSTSGLRFAIQFWHAKTPVFTYPRGWFPWYIEWILGFPRCPYGGVSINVWSTACGTAIALVSDLIVYVVLFVRDSSSRSATPAVAGVKQKQKVKVPVPAGKAS